MVGIGKAKRVENILIGRRKDEVAHRVLAKTEKEFVEKNIRLITVSHVGDQIVFSGDQRSVGRALRVQDLLINLMSDEVEEVDEEENQAFEYLTTKKVDIPPLFCQVSCQINISASKLFFFAGGGQSQGLVGKKSGAVHGSPAKSTWSREGWRSGVGEASLVLG